MASEVVNLLIDVSSRYSGKGAFQQAQQNARMMANSFQQLNNQAMAPLKKNTSDWILSLSTISGSEAIKEVSKQFVDMSTSIKRVKGEGRGQFLDFFKPPKALTDYNRALQNTNIITPRVVTRLLALNQAAFDTTVSGTELNKELIRQYMILEKLQEETTQQSMRLKELKGNQDETNFKSLDTLRIMTLFGSAAQGAVFATSILSGNVLMAAFSIIFMRFSMIKVMLASAGVTVSFLLLVKITKSLVGLFVAMGKASPRIARMFQLIGRDAKRAGRILSREFMAPIEDGMKVFTNSIREGIKYFSDMMRTFTQDKDVAQIWHDFFLNLGAILAVITKTVMKVLIDELVILMQVMTVIANVINIILRPFSLFADLLGIAGVKSEQLSNVMSALLYPVIVLVQAMIVKLIITMILWVKTAIATAIAENIKLVLALRKQLIAIMSNILAWGEYAVALVARVIPAVIAATIAFIGLHAKIFIIAGAILAAAIAFLILTGRAEAAEKILDGFSTGLDRRTNPSLKNLNRNMDAVTKKRKKIGFALEILTPGSTFFQDIINRFKKENLDTTLEELKFPLRIALGMPDVTLFKKDIGDFWKLITTEFGAGGIKADVAGWNVVNGMVSLGNGIVTGLAALKDSLVPVIQTFWDDHIAQWSGLLGNKINDFPLVKFFKEDLPKALENLDFKDIMLQVLVMGPKSLWWGIDFAMKMIANSFKWVWWPLIKFGLTTVFGEELVSTMEKLIDNLIYSIREKLSGAMVDLAAILSTIANQLRRLSIIPGFSGLADTAEAVANVLRESSVGIRPYTHPSAPGQYMPHNIAPSPTTYGPQPVTLNITFTGNTVIGEGAEQELANRVSGQIMREIGRYRPAIPGALA